MFPKCFPYWIIDDVTVKNTKIKEITYSSRGYLLPCCWCDKTNEYENLKKTRIFDESLKLSNVKSVEEVLNSEIWKTFFKNLEQNNDLENIPNICKIKCSELPSWGKK